MRRPWTSWRKSPQAALAAPGDLVLLLGKGHENSIIYADKTLPDDEIGEEEKALTEMK